MSNVIRYDRRPDLPPLRMSNGATDVLWDLLRAAAAVLGVAAGENVPWRARLVAQERATLLRVIDAALAGAGRNRLDHAPEPDRARRNLAAFKALIEAYRPP